MTTITTIMVPGMTCGHCIAAVTKEVEAVAGVKHLSIELHKGAESEVSILSDAPISNDVLTEAIDEAGFDVASISVQENAEVAQFDELAAKRAELASQAEAGN